MMPWSWSLGNVNLIVRWGDLLTAPLDEDSKGVASDGTHGPTAWVNPENSAFQMARGGSSVSAQLRAVFPETQAKLDELVGEVNGERRILTEGSVLVTTTRTGRTLFHAGHHHPWNWLRWEGDASDDELSTHAEILERCVQTVLDRLGACQVSRVAFPMIGTVTAHPGTLADLGLPTP